MDKTISVPFFEVAYVLYPRDDPRSKPLTTAICAISDPKGEPRGSNVTPTICPRSKSRKPLKRSALRGVVTRAGVTCDARPLSCYTFEQGNPARICDEYTPAEYIGILAGSGGDILFPAGRGPLLLSLRR